MVPIKCHDYWTTYKEGKKYNSYRSFTKFKCLQKKNKHKREILAQILKLLTTLDKSNTEYINLLHGKH